MRRRFLRFCRIAPGWKVLEVGVGSGRVARDLAAMVGPRGHVTDVLDHLVSAIPHDHRLRSQQVLICRGQPQQRRNCRTDCAFDDCRRTEFILGLVEVKTFTASRVPDPPQESGLGSSIIGR